jgi:hypothetical protein
MLVTCFMLDSSLAYSSTLKMKVTFCSKTSIDFQRRTRRYIPEDSAFHNHCCENFKSYLRHVHSHQSMSYFRLQGKKQT